MTFDEALPLFKDASLDFIYVDGYAHTGQDGGATLATWYPKLKPGGFFAGHDYHPRWKPTMEAVDAFTRQHELHFAVANIPDNPKPDPFPSWWLVKPGAELTKTMRVDKFNDQSPVLPGQSVVLVGNGPSVLLRGDIGDTIDGFGQVVRFNHYAIRGFERKVGTRTTLWSTFGRGLTPKDPEEKPNRALYIFGDKPPSLPFPMAEVFGVSRSFYNALRLRVQARSKRDSEAVKKIIPSSGLVVAAWLLEVHEVPVLTLFGFDHFRKKESTGHHYWIPRAFAQPKEHDGEAEATIFGEFRDSGRVNYL
jgi:hypothetical protein